MNLIRFLYSSVPLLLVLAVFLLPSLSFAQEGLTNCSGTDCSFCNLVDMANEIISWLIGVLFVVFAVIMVVAGFQLVTSGGNQTALDGAKSKLTNAIIGIIIVLAAWLIVDTLMKALVSGGELEKMGGLGPWNEIECTKQVKPISRDISSDPDSSAVTNTPTPGTAITPSGELTSYGGYQYDTAVVDKVKYLDENFNLTVSSGYRDPERNAAVGGSPTSHHLTGRAADYVGSEEALQAGKAWALQNGAREVLIHNAGSGRHLHVAW